MIKYISDLTKQGPLQPWEQPYFMKRFYQDLFRIKETCFYTKPDGNLAVKQFTDKNDPLRMVSRSNRDGMMYNAAYLSRLREYTTYEIYKLTGIPFDRWLQLPIHLVDSYISEFRRERQIIENIKAGDKRKLENSMNSDAEARYMQELANSSKALR